MRTAVVFNTVHDQGWKRDRMRSADHSRTSGGFSNHNAQAAMLLTGVGIALGLGPAIQLAKAGPAGMAAAAVLGLIIGAGPLVLVRLFQAGYMDNGCLSTLAIVGGTMGIAYLTRRLEWQPEAKAAALLTCVAFLPWIFYGSIWGLIWINDRRQRKPEESPKKPDE
jgi:hypothetical protein